jgi:hypothetical protein
MKTLHYLRRIRLSFRSSVGGSVPVLAYADSYIHRHGEEHRVRHMDGPPSEGVVQLSNREQNGTDFELEFSIGKLLIDAVLHGLQKFIFGWSGHFTRVSLEDLQRQTRFSPAFAGGNALKCVNS